MQDAIAGLVPAAAVVVQLLQDRHQQLEVLEAVEVLLLDLILAGAVPFRIIMRHEWLVAQVKCGAIVCRPSATAERRLGRSTRRAERN